MGQTDVRKFKKNLRLSNWTIQLDLQIRDGYEKFRIFWPSNDERGSCLLFTNLAFENNIKQPRDIAKFGCSIGSHAKLEELDWVAY